MLKEPRDLRTVYRRLRNGRVGSEKLAVRDDKMDACQKRALVTSPADRPQRVADAVGKKTTGRRLPNFLGPRAG